MTTRTLIDIARRELACRVTGGLEVILYWSALDNSTSIDVHQPATQETISFLVRPDLALDAFHHPFAHLASMEKNDEQTQWN